MAEYIEREAALKICEMHYQHCLMMNDWCGDATADGIKTDIETLSAADVAEVRHGEWVDIYENKYSNHFYACSVCGGKALYDFEVDELGHERAVQVLSLGCPHCLAKMDGKGGTV